MVVISGGAKDGRVAGNMRTVWRGKFIGTTRPRSPRKMVTEFDRFGHMLPCSGRLVPAISAVILTLKCCGAEMSIKEVDDAVHGCPCRGKLAELRGHDVWHAHPDVQRDVDALAFSGLGIADGV